MNDVESRCKKQGPYWDWVREEARKINSDGCTKGLQIGECCCLEHDLSFHYGRDPQEAFKVGWAAAPAISFMRTNLRFVGCLPFLLKYRFLAVATFGYPLWEKARKERP
jgi:hypothetical protein